MICLDTNYLILGLLEGSKESKELIGWHLAGEILVTPMPAWYEFLCGPVSDIEIEAMRAFLVEIVPFGEGQAQMSSQLFEYAGRKRSLKIDSMIAGTALLAGAKLATNNRGDFKQFTGAGLVFV